VKSYDGRVNAVDGISLDIAKGEFLTLLGPSGSGKTTTLMMIAGFEGPTSGAIELAGEDLTRRKPYERNIGVVFQNYALFPPYDGGTERGVSAAHAGVSTRAAD
jgi:putative spermidine/putrescine transport system ATP-binding protein